MNFMKIVAMGLLASALFLFPNAGWADDSYRQGTVKPSFAMVYSDPDSSYFPLATLYRGHEVRVFKRQGKRFFVQYRMEGETREGWIDREAVLVGKLVQSQASKKEKRVYPGVVTAPKAVVYNRPGGKPMFSYPKGESVQILTQSKGWYRVRVEPKPGQETEGWVQKSDVRLNQGSSSTASSGEGEISAESPDFAPRIRGVRFFGTPVFDLYRFGTTQMKFGIAYDHNLSPALTVGVPVSFSLRGGFNALQAGLDVILRLGTWKKFSFFERTGLYFERFWGNGTSFMALTGDVGLGASWEINPSVSLALEPLSLEVTPLATEGLPWFMRFQTLLTARIQW